MTASPIRDRLQKLKQKRGVVLLIVVSLLALFVLLGVSFALVASHSVTASKLDREIQRVGDPPETEADLILGQILYDTVARTSLQNHSLLQDLYGTDSVTGTVAQVPFPYDSVPAGSSGSQISRFRVTPNVGPTLPVWSTVPNYYSGRVITFLSGPAVNKSSRVLGFAYEPPSMTYPTGFYELLIESISPLPAQGDEFLINGAPFNGTGAGYDTYTRNVDAILSHMRASTPPVSDLVNLLPHFTGYDATNCRIVMDAQGATPQPGPVNLVGLGGLDETWDAPDLQNMALAMVPPDAAESAAKGTYRPIIPSFHRPELIQYWWFNRIQTEIFRPASITDLNIQAQWLAYPYGADRLRDTADDQSSPIPLEQRDRIYNITRGCIFRPMPWDHPNFSGSNTAFATTNPLPLFTALINGNNLPLWDVDNDNDGLPESIWIDPGLPVVTAPDGRRYKRLAAIYVQDLDGRINLNAHGNLQQIPATAHAGLTNQYGGTQKNVGLGNDNHRADTLLPGPFGLAIPANYGNSLALPRGLGFGPAEVDFLHLFGLTNDANARAAYGEILSRRYESRFPFTRLPTPTTTTSPTRGRDCPECATGWRRSSTMACPTTLRT